MSSKRLLYGLGIGYLCARIGIFGINEVEIIDSDYPLSRVVNFKGENYYTWYQPSILRGIFLDTVIIPIDIRKDKDIKEYCIRPAKIRQWKI